jgi:putative lipoic acid-binding regulatory protein
MSFSQSCSINSSKGEYATVSIFYPGTVSIEALAKMDGANMSFSQSCSINSSKGEYATVSIFYPGTVSIEALAKMDGAIIGAQI